MISSPDYGNMRDRSNRRFRMGNRGMRDTMMVKESLEIIRHFLRAYEMLGAGDVTRKELATNTDCTTLANDKSDALNENDVIGPELFQRGDLGRSLAVRILILGMIEQRPEIFRSFFLIRTKDRKIPFPLRWWRINVM